MRIEIKTQSHIWHLRIALSKLLALTLVLSLAASLMTPNVYAITCGTGSNITFTDIGGGVCRGFITSGTSFTVPTDWNSSNNTIELIGGGGGGKAAAASGGGGGAYVKNTNVSLTGGGSVTVQVGAAGTNAAVDAGDTVFNSAATVCGSVSSPAMCAQGGRSATTTTSTTPGGLDVNSVGTAKSSGGYGGAGTGVANGGGGGGGGAAGPNGVGAKGGTGGGANQGGGGGGGNGGGFVGANSTSATGGTGGNNSGNSGGGAGGNPPTAGSNGGGGGGSNSTTAGVAGALGGAGTEWDATHGSGGGGGGGGGVTSGTGATGGAGGSYGGGGGGGGRANPGNSAGGAGTQGIIVVTYTPSGGGGGGLSCSVTTAALCTGGTNVIVLRMSAATNAHAELSSQSTASYASNVICCSGVTGLGNSCSGTFGTVVKLQAVTNSHVQENNQTGYTQSACLSISAGTVTIANQASNCTGYDTTVLSMPAVTNSHVGGPSNYTNKVCASAAATSLTLSVSTDSFGAISPGTAQFATSTIAVSTNNASGWSVSLTSDNRTLTNTAMDLNSDPTVGITDQTDWIPGAATTSAGNAVRINSLVNSSNVLAFRVMTASGTTPFLAPSWWGSTDSYSDSATTLWAGLASTSAVNTKIGNSSVANASALNTVLYYLKVPLTQQTGAYTAPLTVTAVANP